jgi:hypothetical protein
VFLGKFDFFLKLTCLESSQLVFDMLATKIEVLETKNRNGNEKETFFHSFFFLEDLNVVQACLVLMT